MEVCNLNEIGYLLAPTQQDLTYIQKLFLFYGYQEFRKLQEEEQNNKGKNKATHQEREAFKKRYREQQLKNRQKHEQHIRSNP